jgi:hypothetical protein
MLRAKETSKSASHSLRKIAGVNISITLKKKVKSRRYISTVETVYEIELMISRNMSLLSQNQAFGWNTFCEGNYILSAEITRVPLTSVTFINPRIPI